jgi:hypothetical protein
MFRRAQHKSKPSGLARPAPLVSIRSSLRYDLLNRRSLVWDYARSFREGRLAPRLDKSDVGCRLREHVLAAVPSRSLLLLPLSVASTWSDWRCWRRPLRSSCSAWSRGVVSRSGDCRSQPTARGLPARVEGGCDTLTSGEGFLQPRTQPSKRKAEAVSVWLAS